MRNIVHTIGISALAMTAIAAPIQSAVAQEPGEQIVFVGQLLSVTMTRRDFSARTEPDENGRIVVSNSCGALDAVFSVTRSTAPLPERVEVSLTLGEWCEEEIRFDRHFWLIVLDAETRDYVAGYELFDDDYRAFAFEESDEDRLADYSPAVRRMLTAIPLPEPIRYPFGMAVTPEEAAERRPDLEVDEDWLVITRGVAIDAIFPGFTIDEFFDRPPR